MKDYIKSLRKKIGNQKIIHPAARIIVENEHGKILTIVRTDNGNFGLPAGALEEGETIEACIRREVLEETGLVIDKVELIGLSTSPFRETVIYPNGDQTQYFTAEFYTNEWSGSLLVKNEEATDIQFRGKEIITHLPPIEQSTFQSLDYFRSTGKVRVD